MKQYEVIHECFGMSQYVHLLYAEKFTCTKSHHMIHVVWIEGTAVPFSNTSRHYYKLKVEQEHTHVSLQKEGIKRGQGLK